MPRIPSEQDCFALLEKYEVPEIIVEHSRQVAKVALYLGEKLSGHGEKINLKLLLASALLHDIDKKICLDDPTKKHAVEASSILKREGFPEIAEIVRQHRLNQILEAHFTGWEAKLVYYADKRVRHTEIVSLQERFDYLLERYGSLRGEVKQGILAAKPKVFALEREILSKAKADVSLGELR